MRLISGETWRRFVRRQLPREGSAGEGGGLVVRTPRHRSSACGDSVPERDDSQAPVSLDCSLYDDDSGPGK